MLLTSPSLKRARCRKPGVSAVLTKLRPIIKLSHQHITISSHHFFPMKIALFSTKRYDRHFFDLFNRDEAHEITYFENRLDTSTAGLTSGFPVVCAFVNDTLDREVLQILAGSGVRLVAMRCAGYNNVDLPAAKELGIDVVRVPAYSPYAVAEHTVALILTLNRKTHKAYNRVREGNFALDRLEGFDLFGKTVGVVGTGQIGTIFAKIMIGFGCNVIAFDPFPNKDLEKTGVTFLPKKELLSESDIVSLHCPLTPETYHFIDDIAIKRFLKPGAMLINTSRGALLDSKAVIDGLKKKRIGYLGIDVYEQEADFFFEDLSEEIIDDDLLARLLSFPNVLVTSHQGFFTEEALTEIARTTLENITHFENGTFLAKNKLT